MKEEEEDFIESAKLYIHGDRAQTYALLSIATSLKQIIELLKGGNNGPTSTVAKGK